MYLDALFTMLLKIIPYLFNKSIGIKFRKYLDSPGGGQSTKMYIIWLITVSQIRPQTREWGSIFKLISKPQNVEFLDYLVIFGSF